MSNSFGKRFVLTTFGESHGKAIGCILDGVVAGLKIDEKFIQSELDRRRPGLNRFATQRKEDDRVEILSGVFEGVSTGTPIAMIIYNKDQKSKDYSNIKDLFRPSHADFTYFHKYGIRDYRGGGRSSARETATRVAAGAVAKLMLKELGIEVMSGIYNIGGVESREFDFEYAKESEIYALDKELEPLQKERIDKARESKDSVGGSALVVVKNAPVGLGEGLYNKLDAQLAAAMMGINAVKGVEIGEGCNASNLTGSQNNDEIDANGFKTNRSGGILGGMSNSDDIIIKVHFKPTPSIYQKQDTVDIHNNEVTCELKGRHDPCVAIRGSVVAEAMASLVIADMLLLNLSSKLSSLKEFYKR